MNYLENFGALGTRLKEIIAENEMPKFPVSRYRWDEIKNNPFANMSGIMIAIQKQANASLRCVYVAYGTGSDTVNNLRRAYQFSHIIYINMTGYESFCKKLKTLILKDFTPELHDVALSLHAQTKGLLPRPCTIDEALAYEQSVRASHTISYNVHTSKVKSELEFEVYEALLEAGVDFVPKCVISASNKVKVDFVVPDKKIIIECQGAQHFKAIDYYGGEERFFKQQMSDYEKKKMIQQAGYRVLYYAHANDVPKRWNKYFVITSLDNLITTVKCESEYV